MEGLLAGLSWNLLGVTESLSVQRMSNSLVELRRNIWKYTGPIFDSHTHIINTSTLQNTIQVQENFGVKAQIAISHSLNARIKAEKQFPGRFVFAKYLSIRDVISFNEPAIIRAIDKMDEEGYSLAKMWAAPPYREWVKSFSLRSPRLESIFSQLTKKKFPLILHVADPDTFFTTTYANSKIFGTKEEHLDQLEYLIEKYPDLQFQLAHFASQPEVHRLPQLGEWFDKYPNIVVDTASSRWMARELSKDPKESHRFLRKYSKRILFGTDANISHLDQAVFDDKIESSYLQTHYGVRCLAQRILWETNEQNVPLPFLDADTVNTGGTFINGLNLPQSVLKAIYWENAQRLYGSMIC